MKLTIKRRIMLLYTLLTTILLGILLPIVYVTVSASLNLDIQSRLNNAIAQVLIAVDDQDEKFVLNDQVDLPDYISMCVTDGNGKLIFSTPGGEWLPQVSTDTTGNTIYRNETYTVLKEKFKLRKIPSPLSQQFLRLCTAVTEYSQAAPHYLNANLSCFFGCGSLHSGQKGNPPHCGDHQSGRKHQR